MHSESLRRVLALAVSGVRFAAAQLDPAGVARSNPRLRLLAQRLRRLAAALEQAGRFDG